VFQILKDPHFDFMGKRNLALPASVVLVLASVMVLYVHGLNLGIEFTGGTELQVKYAAPPDLPQIRRQLASVGLGTPVVTTIGDPEGNEVYIRLAARGAVDEKEDPTVLVLNSLRGLPVGFQGSGHDLNIEDEDMLAALLREAPTLTDTEARTIASQVLEARREGVIFKTHQDLASLSGVTPDVISYLESNTTIGPLALRSQSFIGPAVGRELIDKAIIAVIGSLIGMLVYIWIRFKLQWGFAAVAALAHDTVITLALFSIFGQEMSLPVVAAFLTLVGYSVNDTVVVFDRIRENLAS
jgi:preprotein translocase subunit SecF